MVKILGLQDIRTIVSVCFYGYILPIILILLLLGSMYFVSIIPKIDAIDQTIVNYGYLGSFLSGTLGIVLTAGSLIFLAKTLNFERKKSEQENFDNKFFLMLEILENIKNNINENLKDKILNEIDEVSEFTIKDTLEKSKKIIHKYNSELGHYYRMLYQILKMIHKCEDKIVGFDNVDIVYYTNILRSTLDFKLTQILAINTYYSDNFDSEYKDYAVYARKYNFFEHMPFCITKDRISESLLAVYLYCDEGFGDSSFVKKMNRYIIDSIRKSISFNYKYDLKCLFLKRLIGEWNVENVTLKISLDEKIFCFKTSGRNWYGELINTKHPESEILSKCEIFNYGGYDVYSFFDENLNFIINFDEYSYIQNNDHDYRDVKIKLISEGIGDLCIEFTDDSYIFDEYDFIQPRIKLERKNKTSHT